MMKILKTILASVAVLVSMSAAAQSFDEIYSKTDDVYAAFRKISNGPVSPVWTDADSFMYSTNVDGVQKTYRVKVSDQSKVEIPRDTLDAYVNAHRRQRPGDPSDDSYYYMRRANRPHPSPDGKMEAFIKDNNVWLRSGEVETQLSFDGTDADSYVQVMWSPDSRKIAAMRKENMKERQILLRESRPADQVQPKYNWLDYAKPGDALPQETPALFDVEKKAQIPFSTAAYQNQYFLEMGTWSPDSRYFTFEYNQRGHQLYQLVAVDAETGANRILAEEKTNTFVYYYDLYRYYFKDGRRILWISERDDYRHLYMIDAANGSMKQLTKGEWNVREIHKVDEQSGTIWFNANGYAAASGEDPYNKHLLKLDIASGKITDLTPENAWHDISFNPDQSIVLDNYSRPDLTPVSVLRSAEDGKILMSIQKTDISALQKIGFTMPEVFVAKGRDGKTDIWGTIYRPTNFNPRKKYPVVEYIYAGPHDSHVEKMFPTAMPRWYRLMELGFVVVCIDGMGTDNRSKSFQDVAWRNIKDAGFPDRILWMQAAAQKYKYLDLSNVGIYGYSAGGQNTLSALLFHPEFYKVGVALCGCHDNRMDKIWWNEQWMGYPIGPWYSESSNVDNASKLQGKLFIINGEMDDNVDPASSLQVVAELVKAGKDFEQLYLPGHTHNLGSEYITKRVYKFFWENRK